MANGFLFQAQQAPRVNVFSGVGAVCAVSVAPLPRYTQSHGDKSTRVGGATRASGCAGDTVERGKRRAVCLPAPQAGRSATSSIVYGLSYYGGVRRGGQSLAASAAAAAVAFSLRLASAACSVSRVCVSNM